MDKEGERNECGCDGLCKSDGEEMNEKTLGAEESGTTGAKWAWSWRIMNAFRAENFRTTMIIT